MYICSLEVMQVQAQGYILEKYKSLSSIFLKAVFSRYFFSRGAIVENNIKLCTISVALESLRKKYNYILISFLKIKLNN